MNLFMLVEEEEVIHLRNGPDYILDTKISVFAEYHPGGALCSKKCFCRYFVDISFFLVVQSDRKDDIK